MTEYIPMCIEMELASIVREEAKLGPHNEPPADASSNWYSRNWPSHAWLRVRFLDGEPAIHRRVQAIAKEWTKYAVINFKFGDFADAEIRISFSTPYLWSYVGTDALFVPPDQPTMCLGATASIKDPSTLRHVVLHEFGHVLGLIHTPMSPHQYHTIHLNIDTFTSYFDRVIGHEMLSDPMDRLDIIKQIRLQHFRQTSDNSLSHPRSIMRVDVPRAFYVNTRDLAGNTTEIDLDRSREALVSAYGLNGSIPDTEQKFIRELTSFRDYNPFRVNLTEPNRAEPDKERNPPDVDNQSSVKHVSLDVRESRMTEKEVNEKISISGQDVHPDDPDSEGTDLPKPSMSRLKSLDGIENEFASSDDHASHVSQTNTGGGPIIGGDVNVGGDFIGRDQIVYHINLVGRFLEFVGAETILSRTTQVETPTSITDAINNALKAQPNTELEDGTIFAGRILQKFFAIYTRPTDYDPLFLRNLLPKFIGSIFVKLHEDNALRIGISVDLAYLGNAQNHKSEKVVRLEATEKLWNETFPGKGWFQLFIMINDQASSQRYKLFKKLVVKEESYRIIIEETDKAVDFEIYGGYNDHEIKVLMAGIVLDLIRIGSNYAARKRETDAESRFVEGLKNLVNPTTL